ncbi:chemokine-like receptor 1 [Astyanax mexicanus]|uniref:Chemokine-like receptor 1 n=1 Tax=Astyanax mexicanus TaxID=7994 RepID=A0A8B9HBF6_ASTMX|nr:chemokine-like receptor 1 [Astyanax mexicanus]
MIKRDMITVHNLFLIFSLYHLFCRISEMDPNATAEYDYSALIEAEKLDTAILGRIRMQYIVAYLIFCILGVILNAYVIIAGCRVYHNLQKSAPSVWVLALAVTHLISSAFLVMQFLYAWHHFNWKYGTALCKISSYVIYTSMFSTAALLSMWTISSSFCIQGLCTKCGINSITTVLVLVLSSWTLGTILSVPSLFSREIRYTRIGEECIDDFDLDDNKTTDYGREYMIIVVLSRFLLGVLGPMLVMIIFTFTAGRQGRNEDATCRKITCVIKLMYFVCWTPLLSMGLHQAIAGNSVFVEKGLPGATILAAAHSFINPVIYLLVGHKLNMHWMVHNTRENTIEGMPLNEMVE